MSFLKRRIDGVSRNVALNLGIAQTAAGGLIVGIAATLIDQDNQRGSSQGLFAACVVMCFGVITILMGIHRTHAAARKLLLAPPDDSSSIEE